jgi:carboxyl-terminal processing protease
MNKKIITTIVGVGLITGSFFAGSYVERAKIDAAFATTPENLQKVFAQSIIDPSIDTSLYGRVWNILKSTHVDKPLSDKELFYGSLEGLVSGIGDPYTTFFRPKEAEKFASSLDGKFFGIGAQLEMKDDALMILATLPETPAARAGLKSGDFIIKIDDIDTYGMNVDEAVDKIRGSKGTKVKLTIIREGERETKDYTITRDEINIKSVASKIENNIQTLSIAQFGGDTARLFFEFLDEGKKAGVKGYVIDLRSNPGGFLDTSVTLASQWIKEGVIVREKFSDGSEETYNRIGDTRLVGVPTVVLVNEYSASASEILAGALQDFGVATIVGNKTFGKGSVQTMQELPDGSAIKITIAKWYTPKGRSIDKQGVMPDVEIKRGDDPKKDVQMEKAIELLKEKIK